MTYEAQRIGLATHGSPDALPEICSASSHRLRSIAPSLALLCLHLVIPCLSSSKAQPLPTSPAGAFLTRLPAHYVVAWDRLQQSLNICNPMWILSNK